MRSFARFDDESLPVMSSRTVLIETVWSENFTALDRPCVTTIRSTAFTLDLLAMSFSLFFNAARVALEPFTT